MTWTAGLVQLISACINDMDSGARAIIHDINEMDRGARAINLGISDMDRGARAINLVNHGFDVRGEDYVRDKDHVLAF